MNSGWHSVNVTFDIESSTYSSALTIVSYTGLFINLFGLFIIVFKSPIHFKNYRWHLATYQIWSLILDAMAGFLSVPVFFLPLPVGCTTGLLSALSVHSANIMFTIILLIFGTLSAMLQVLFYRWQQLLPAVSKMKVSKKYRAIPIIVGYIFFVMPHVFLFPRTLEDQQSAREELVEHFPMYDPVANLSSILIFYLPHNHNFLQYMQVLAGLSSFGGFILLCFLAHTATIVRRKDRYVPERTQIAHRKLLVALSTQITVPLITMMEPAALISLVILLRVWNVQVLVHIAWFIFSNHGLVSTIVLCTMNDHYRLVLYKKFIKRNPDLARPISLNNAVAYKKGEETTEIRRDFRS